MTVHPVYRNEDGSWSVKLDVILYVWELMQKQGKVKQVFSAGTVKNDIDFVRHMTSDRVHPVVLAHKDDIMGVAWLTEYSDRFGSAMPHFCAFRNGENYSYKEIIDGGKAILAFWRDLPNLKILVGHTPKNNRTAVRFNEALGMVRGGEVPGMMASMNDKRNDAVIFYMNMES